MIDNNLVAVMHWLSNAQDSKREDRGISAGYQFGTGWKQSYPETTGYIINTFLNFGHITNNPTWISRSIEAGDWLITTQFSDGAFPGGFNKPNAKPRVFNTGMILFGLSELSILTGNSRYAEPGKRALKWLVNNLDDDGTWTLISPEKQPHAYHLRVAWGMLRMANALYQDEIPEDILLATKRVGDWVIRQQDNNGWFNNNDLINGLPPLTHNIAYTLRGVLELGSSLNISEYVDSANLGAEKILLDFEEYGYLAACYGPSLHRLDSFRCVTGEAQMGIVWLRLFELTGSKRFKVAAKKIEQQVRKTQFLYSSKLIGMYGGIPGSWPIWGKYLRFTYPNWAAKFFADLIMMLTVTS